MDGTLIEAWAGQKSFQKKDTAAAPSTIRAIRRWTSTARSAATRPTSPRPIDARLYRKGPGKEAKLSYQGQVLMENRNGLVTGTRLTQATGTAEREAAVDMTQQIAGRDGQRATLGADKAYDTQDFVQRLRDRTSPRMWRKTPATARVRSTGVHAAAGTLLANANANGWKRSSAGSRP